METGNESTPPRPDNLRRDLTYLLYGFAILALSITTFGWIGVLPGILIPVFWLTVYCNSRRPMALAYALTVVVSVYLLICLCWPAVSRVTESGRRTQCRNSLYNIGLALHNYHDEYGSFPPAYTTDEDGRRLHSWRTLILYFVDQGPLLNQVDLSEPWDSPHNRELLSEVPGIYACPTTLNERDNTTSYLAVVGEGTVWPGTGTISIPEINDGLEQTILVVECDAGFHWAEPRDLELDEALTLLSSSEERDIHGHGQDTVFHDYQHGSHLLFADGRVRFAPIGTDQATWH
jgi:hypothetical protein